MRMSSYSILMGLQPGYDKESVPPEGTLLSQLWQEVALGHRWKVLMKAGPGQEEIG